MAFDSKKFLDLNGLSIFWGKAQSYINDQDAAALASAKSYADDHLATAKSYADDHLATAKSYTNGLVEGINTAAAALEGRVATAEGKISTLEGKMETAEGKITTLETEVAKKANDADLAAIAKTGSTDDLVQGAMVLLLNCGGAE